MPSYQRKRGREVKLWPAILKEDARGNTILETDIENMEPLVTTAAEFPQRSSRAEVPGQQQIIVTRLIVSEDAGMGLWGKALWEGEMWDIVAPPTYHHGTRHTRHWSIDIRKRPVAIT